MSLAFELLALVGLAIIPWGLATAVRGQPLFIRSVERTVTWLLLGFLWLMLARWAIVAYWATIVLLIVIFSNSGANPYPGEKPYVPPVPSPSPASSSSPSPH